MLNLEKIRRKMVVLTMEVVINKVEDTVLVLVIIIIIAIRERI